VLPEFLQDDMTRAFGPLAGRGYLRPSITFALDTRGGPEVVRAEVAVDPGQATARGNWSSKARTRHRAGLRNALEDSPAPRQFVGGPGAAG